MSKSASRRDVLTLGAGAVVKRKGVLEKLQVGRLGKKWKPKWIELDDNQLIVKSANKKSEEERYDLRHTWTRRATVAEQTSFDRRRLLVMTVLPSAGNTSSASRQGQTATLMLAADDADDLTEFLRLFNRFDGRRQEEPAGDPEQQQQ